MIILCCRRKIKLNFAFFAECISKASSEAVFWEKIGIKIVLNFPKRIKSGTKISIIYKTKINYYINYTMVRIYRS